MNLSKCFSPAFELTDRFNKDPHPQKVNLVMGTYKDEQSRSHVLPVVRKAELLLGNDFEKDHEYLPLLGLEAFTKETGKLVLGQDSLAVKSGLVESIQTIAGTGALRLALDFLVKTGSKDIYISTPSYVNHEFISQSAGFKVHRYRYYDYKDNSLDFKGLVEDLQRAPENSVVLIQACAQNPCGMDLNTEQWIILSKILKERNMVPLIDIAYQGFVTGDLDKDAEPLRKFVEAENHQLVLIAQSHSKNLTLYDERTGSLIIVAANKESLNACKLDIYTLIRSYYSNPPAHGARVASFIMTDPSLNAEWKEDLKEVADRIRKMRRLLFDKLTELGTKGGWSHILETNGLFFISGLNEKQCVELVSKYHVYVMPDGRINVSAVTENNLDYVANAIHSVAQN